MDEKTPTTPGPDALPTPPVAVPNPHSGEAQPDALSGIRPEAEASRDEALAAGSRGALPIQDEPGGPLAGLVGTASTQAAAEATPANTDTALLEQMGVESEGIESGQLLGLVVAVVISVIGLVVVLVFLFYIPFRQQVGNSASDVLDYPELEQSETEARAKLNQFARADSTYQVPIDQAMSVVAGRYRAADTSRASGLPETRQQWNTLMANRGTGTAVQTPAGMARRTSVEQERLAALSNGEAGAAPGRGLPRRAPGQTDEQVGTDGTPTAPAPTTLGEAQSDG